MVRARRSIKRLTPLESKSRPLVQSSFRAAAFVAIQRHVVPGAAQVGAKPHTQRL